MCCVLLLRDMLNKKMGTVIKVNGLGLSSVLFSFVVVVFGGILYFDGTMTMVFVLRIIRVVICILYFSVLSMIPFW